MVAGSEQLGPGHLDFAYWLVDAVRTEPEKLRMLQNAMAAVFALERGAQSVVEVEDYVREAISFLENEPDESVWRSVCIWLRHWLRRIQGEDAAEAFSLAVDPNVLPEKTELRSHIMGSRLADQLEQVGLKKGLERGLEKGRQEGRQEGSEEAYRCSIRRFLQRRFSYIPEAVEESLKTISSVQRLQNLLDEAAFCEDLDAFVKSLSGSDCQDA